ncbi:MAG: glycosyltransferase [Deltaproteobacteria bacterium]|jgi:glycosyltransferase involved in cell wall biosynthesis
MGRRRRIRLCQLTPCLWSGGTEERLARVMAAMDRSEFELTWMGFGPVREALIDRAGPSIDVVPFLRNVGGGVEPQLVLQIARQLRKRRPDVMHIHNWSTSLYGIAAARLAGVPCVAYGLGGAESADEAPPRRKKAMRALAPHVDRFTAVCRFLGDRIQENWAVPSSRVSVLRTGIDLDWIDRGPSGAEIRERLGLAPDALIVGAVSVLRPVKRIHDLIEAVGRIAPRFPRLQLVIGGNPLGVSLDELRAQAEALGLEDRIVLLGRVVHPEHLLRAFDVFVNCSAFEGASNAILEAMAARVPVVATAVGGTPELIDDGVEGLLVPPAAPARLGDALARLLADPELRTSAQEAGRRRIESRHTFTHMVDGYLAFYRESGARAADVGRAARTASAMWTTLQRLAAS